MNRLVGFLRAAFLVSMLTLAGGAQAKVYELVGTVSSFSDGLGLFGTEDLSGLSMTGSVEIPDVGCTRDCYYKILPLKIGAYIFDFYGGASTFVVANDASFWYLFPYQPASINGGEISYIGKSAGSISINSNGFSTWGFSIWKDFNQESRVSIAGSATVAAIPEPSTYLMMLIGIALLIASQRRLSYHR